MKPRFLLCGLFLVTSLIAAGDVAYFQDQHQPYVINWESIACDSRDFLVMGNPFETYNDEVEPFSQSRERRIPVAIALIARSSTERG